MALRCIIVDDELMARKSLERLCQKSRDLEVCAICENAQEALEILEKEDVDLLFLDVEMPGLSGIELMDHISAPHQVILTTSKVEYAYEAFQYHVTDYLKKPISFPRFQEAVQKALEHHQLSEESASTTKEIYVREDGRLVRIPYEDILYFENAGDYVLIKTESGQHIIHGTIKSINEKLSGNDFLKVHRSYIVNRTKIKDIEDSTLVIDRKVIPISRGHKNALIGSLNLL